MSGVDQRIVEMTFKGDSFLSGVKNAITSLAGLKSSLNGLKGSENDLNNLNAAGSKFSLKNIADSLTGLSGKFSTLSIIGITALTNIANKAVDAGISLVKSLTIDPIAAGFQKYELGINATQRIIANTGASLKSVTATLNDLNLYSNQTIYNFEQMTQAIGQFTAAGIPLQAATNDIKGMSNAASLTGASMDSLQSAFYQMSQAMAGGVIRLQDWNSLQNAGVADGKEFQQAFEETADSMGHNVDKLVTQQGGFRNSLDKGWLTAGVFSKAMGVMAGSLNTATGQTTAYSVAQLKAMGYTESQAVSLHKLSAAAIDTATKTRTFSQLLDNLKDDASTAWAHVFQAIIGNLPQATAEFTKLSGVLQNLFLGPVNDLATLIDQWNALGGRMIAVTAVKQAFTDLGKVLGVIKQAFDDVFGSGTGGAGVAAHLVVLTGAILKFTEALDPSKKTLAEMKTIFEGLFSAVKIVVDVVGDVIGGFEKIGSAAASASGAGGGGGILKLVATLAQWITDVKNAIESGTALKTFFTDLGTVIGIPLKVLGSIVGALGNLGGAAAGAAAGVIPLVTKIGDAFKGLADAIIKGIQSGDLSKIGTILNQLLLGGVLVQIKKFIAGFTKSGEGGGGLFDSIKESFESLTGALKAMQQNLKSDTLLKIAAAVGILTISLVALSFINIGNLTKALTAMTVMFTELLASLSIVAKIAGSAGIVKMTAIGVALNLLATAILTLTAAVVILSLFSWEQMTKGLTIIGLLLVELAVATQLMSKNTPGLIATAIAMNIMSVALSTMAVAVKLLGSLDYGTLAKGIGSITALLAVMTAFSQFGGGEKLVSTAAAMLLIGAALNVIELAVARLGALSLGTLAKGIVSIAAVMLVLVVAMNGMDGALPGAAALIVASAALLVLSEALSKLGSESWGAIAKALVLLAGSLIIIAAAMILMEGSLPGAAALVVVAGALAILAPILIALGSQPWQVIVTGLLALAGAFAVIGLAGLLIGPLVPVLISLGLAIALIGGGFLAAGVGIGLFAAGLTALAIAVAASGVSILAFVKSMLALIPTTLSEIGQGIVAFAKAIGNGAAAIVGAFVQIIVAIAEGLIKALPKVSAAIGSLITAFLTIVVSNTPKILAAFAKILLDILSSFANNAGKFVTAGANVIISVLNGIAKNVTRVATAAVNMVLSFVSAITTNVPKVVSAAETMIIKMINGISATLRGHNAALDSAISGLGSSIVQGIIGAITALAGGIAGALLRAVQGAIQAAKNWLKSLSPSKRTRDELGIPIIQGIVGGVLQSGGMLSDAMVSTAKTAIDSVKATLSGLSDSVSDNLNLNPTITPVVDLTQAKAGFAQLAGLSKNGTVNATASTQSASAISAQNAYAALQLQAVAGGTSPVSFTQINNSPVALSAATIYRQTNNQLSIARKVLTGSANTG